MSATSASYRPERKGEVADLQRLLQNIQVKRDRRKLKEVIKKVIAYLTLGVDVSRLFSEMVMACQSAEVVIKKMVYLFLTYYARAKSDLAILAINTLRKDCSDADPMVRGLALRSLANLHLHTVLEYITDPLNSGLVDQSAYVRRTAVLGVLKVHHLDCTTVTDNNYVNILYNMLRDPDSKVVSNSVVALNEIMMREGGIVVNTNIVVYLMQRLNEFDEWGKCIILSLLITYAPPTDNDKFSLMNILDGILSYSNSAVVLGACKCFLFISRALQSSVRQQVFQRLKNPLLTLISGYARLETKFVVLQHIYKLVSIQQSIFDDGFKIFYCQFNDPSNIKFMKLKILPYIANRENVIEIVAELSEYVGDINPELAIKAMAALGRIANRLPSISQSIMVQLLEFIQMDNVFVASGATVVLRDVLHRYRGMAAESGAILMATIDRPMSRDARDALFWMIGEFGEDFPVAPYVLERECAKLNTEDDYIIQIELLHAVSKLFLKRAPEMKVVIANLLCYILNAEDVEPDLYDRAVFIYRMLFCNLPSSPSIVNFLCSPPKTIYKKVEAVVILKEFDSLKAVYNSSNV